MLCPLNITDDLLKITDTFINRGIFRRNQQQTVENSSTNLHILVSTKIKDDLVEVLDFIDEHYLGMLIN